MAPLSLLFIVTATDTRCTPNCSETTCACLCKRKTQFPFGSGMTSTSRKQARVVTSIPSALRVASFAAKQAAYRRADFLETLQKSISLLVKIPCSGAQCSRVSSRSTRLLSMISIPDPTITLHDLSLLHRANRPDCNESFQTVFGAHLGIGLNNTRT